jgi:peptidoglycan-associated lipoprotein
MNRATVVPAAVIVGMCVAACSHKTPALAPTPAAPAPAARPAPPAPPPAPARARAASAAPAPLSEDELFRRMSLEELNAKAPLGDVFFDYDKDQIREEGKAVLQHDAEWLKRWPQTRISIDGHCDERGTAEYNLALGSHRAEKVRDYLVELGVPESRMQVKTLGREAPFCTGTGESCWQQNRRDHFIVTAK